jgi:integrase/recombinase XerD
MADVPTVEMSGRLGPFAAGFVDDMRRQCFGPVAVRKHTGLVAGLSGWLTTEDLAPAALSSEVADLFCAARREAGHTYLLTIKSLDPLLGYLRGLGVAPPASPTVCKGPVEELLARFRRYLEQERGLVPAAARGYVDKVRPVRGALRQSGRDGALAGGRGRGPRVRGGRLSAARAASGAADGGRAAVAAVRDRTPSSKSRRVGIDAGRRRHPF